MNFSRSQPPLDPASLRLPLIALIDVVLFLLFYFMVAGTLASEEASLGAAVKTQAAPASAQGATGEISTFALSIDMSGTTPLYHLGSRSFKDQAALTGVLSQLSKSGGIVVRAAPNVPVSAIAAAIQAGKDAGFTRVSYVPTK